MQARTNALRQRGNWGSAPSLRRGVVCTLETPDTRPAVSFSDRSTLMAIAFLGLGSNRGSRLDHLRSAVVALRDAENVDLVAESPVYETEAHTRASDETQAPFLNAVLQVEATLPPTELLSLLQDIERAEGRQKRRRRWAPRVLDIDLLAYDQLVRSDDDLTLPHPRLAERRFVLRPWADVAPTFVVPAPFEATVLALLGHCSDTATVRPTELDLSTIPSHQQDD